MIGRRILDRYRLDELLARGGTAEVWRAFDERLARPVAVKLLHPHLLPDEVSRQRLAAEARAVASLSHPSIVSVYDVDPDGEAPALVMELVDGEPLSALIAREGALDARRVAAIAADIADALYLAHKRGIVHRDVKPGNILLAGDRARLVDFGIAHSLAESAARLTTAGSVIGTLRSMAPEQLAGGRIGPRTDLFGLGTVLFEMLSGRPPYATTSPVGLLEEQRDGPPVLTDVDPSLAELVRACLQPDPDRRPLHAGALASSLRNWLAGETQPAPMVAALPALDRGAVTQTFERPVAAAAPRPARRPAAWRRALGAASAVLLALAAGVVLIALIAIARPFSGGSLSSPTAAPTATPLPAPTPFDIEALPPPVQGEVRDWWERCDVEGDAPPVDLSGMNKHEAESALEPYVDACRDDDDD